MLSGRGGPEREEGYAEEDTGAKEKMFGKNGSISYEMNVADARLSRVPQNCAEESQQPCHDRSRRGSVR